MFIERKFSIVIVDIEKIDEINNVIIRHSTFLKQYSTHFYFNLSPIHDHDISMDITFFKLESDNESELDKKLDNLIEELNQLNTGYAIRDENTHEMVVEIEHVMALDIKFDNVKFIKEGTYEKIDRLNHLKTEFGICKNYNPNFRSVENQSIETMHVEPETIYLFSDSQENLSRLKAMVFEEIMEIDSDFEIDVKPFMFCD